jgi:hypothetical protein
MTRLNRPGGWHPHPPASECRLEIETDQKGQMRVDRKERPRLLSDLPAELAQLIEDVTVDSKGRAVPKLYSKLQASRELRAMLNIGAKEAAPDITKLSDAELVTQLADQAKELGIEIDLNYRFLFSGHLLAGQ